MNNPYELTKEEREAFNNFQSWSDDEKGEYIFHEKQRLAHQDYARKKAQTEHMNSNTVVRDANGSVQIGGALQATSLITVDLGGQSMEMTAQQAIDNGLLDSDALGEQVTDIF